MSLFEIALFIGVLKNQPFTPNSLFLLITPSGLTLQPYLKQDTSVSFSFPPSIFHTNHSQLILPSKCFIYLFVFLHSHSEHSGLSITLCLNSLTGSSPMSGGKLLSKVKQEGRAQGTIFTRLM